MQKFIVAGYLEKKLKFRTLKGPKHEIFGSRVFAQIRPVWVGDLGTRPKNPKSGWFRHENRHFILLSAVGDNAKDFLMLSPTSLQNFKRCSRHRLNLFSVVAYNA